MIVCVQAKYGQVVRIRGAVPTRVALTVTWLEAAKQIDGLWGSVALRGTRKSRWMF